MKYFTYKKIRLNVSLNVDRTDAYTSEKSGSDEQGDGSEAKPWKTPLQVFNQIEITRFDFINI